jgi:acetyl-CoA acetyltransferase
LSSRLRDSCAIAGIGNTAYCRGTDKSTAELHLEASLRAIADAGLKVADIDAIMPHDVSGVSADELRVNLGLPDLAFSSVVRTGGASFISSIQSACLAVNAGIARHVLLPAGRRGYSEMRVSTMQQDASQGQARTASMLATMAEFECPYGSLLPAQFFAQAAHRHMHRYGTTSEHFGHIAVACRKHANLNPQAIMHGRPMSLEDHQSSRLISTPFRLLDCSLESDGAGAVVITSAERASDLAKLPVLVAGFGEGHGNPPTSITQKDDMTFIEGVHTAGQRAFAMAGIGPEDIDCAQLLDPFTWFVLGSLEALGFCAVGEGGPFVEGGRIELGGELPVNTHGGCLSEAHVSGVSHVIEAVRQLRREVERDRQVKECETVLVSNEGDMHDGSVLILHR